MTCKLAGWHDASALVGLALLIGFGPSLTGHADANAQNNPVDLAATELRRADERAQLCSSANARGTGLQGEYFATTGLSGKPAGIRLDGPLDLDLQLDAPLAPGKAKSARWTGWLKAPVTGSYALHLEHPRAAVWIGRQSMVVKGSSGDSRIELAAGRFYPVRIEIPELSAPTGRIRLEWTGPSGSRYVIPGVLLFEPTATAQTSR